MTDVIDVETTDNEKAQSLKSVGWLSYILHLIVAVGAVLPGTQPGVALLIIALVIDLVKKGEAEGTWQASHFSWRIRSVIWAAILYLVTAPLWALFFVPGWIAWGLISIWFLYRIVRGMVNMNDNRPMPR
ncbi:MAG: DUF4870 family protein [Hydrogenophaga sp.]|jgi:uncharacterized membrane protein|uniref:DUF4870 family protein n=1 Tax=Hydrogenophaga intermedia TaxID=65786 RepID=UPI0020445356|nr:hypothetical protein [Hydrogenophaga intermedia]MCM3563949.1 hypothetical protein [Hydrogenophaga intermedia]